MCYLIDSCLLTLQTGSVRKGRLMVVKISIGVRH